MPETGGSPRITWFLWPVILQEWVAVLRSHMEALSLDMLMT